ncbi:hypothetical protein LTR36_004730 [Oleoguttula mirabilis]|uniref:Uncharacterized protein n=1 Tax=Oleoguttula mirabilis TaxID=1507867 RepID=A0AAV9JFZ5_9PEZI|nr:hypothetical protein LTR36_004730 [Oleoguttula mirabilis]
MLRDGGVDQNEVERFLGYKLPPSAPTPVSQPAGIQQPSPSTLANPVEDILIASSTIASSTYRSDPTKPYILTFGKQINHTLSTIPPAYIAWLKSNSVYETNAELRTAFDEWEKVPHAYRFPFGKHEGCTLAEVPPTYLNWLEENPAPAGQEDLRKELRKALAVHRKSEAGVQGALVSNTASTSTASTSTASASTASTAVASTTSTKRKKKPWVIPNDHTTDIRRYYYAGDRRQGQMWIGCNDAVRYFGADPKAMNAAGLRAHHKNQRFWLHQVFSYAQYYGTTKGETPTKALNKFKAKNYNK